MTANNLNYLESSQSHKSRRINVDRVSISGGLAEMQVMNGPYTFPLRETHRPREAVVNGRATSNADSYSRCLPNLDRQLKDNQGGCLYEWPVVKSSYEQEGADPSGTGDRQRKERTPIKRERLSRVSINGVAGEGDSSMCPHRTVGKFWQKPGIGILKSSKCNQTQALTPPVNLVGGALTCEPYLPLVGLKPPCKGGSYVCNRRKR